ncbi:hypothetical protein P5G60_04810 [Paenibacillus jamilae]|nr:hypothetical protein [Paenibacillus jamilae]
MASEKTPNLGLNQIDRTSPKTTYFDLEKYLDENWRSVDKFAGDVNDGVNEIKKRLDTTERKAVTLEPGVQIVHAEKAAPFSLTGLSGRTLVNLLGRMGSCETVSEWSSNVAIAIDNNNKTNGSSSFKITLGSVPATASASFLTTPGRKYIAIADVKSGNTSKVAISINGIASAVGNDVNSGSVIAPSVVRFTAKEYFHILTITGTGAAGNTFNMDSVRVYEISDVDYAAAVSLTPSQAAAKYPYVDSVMPVRNPYAIRYGENLLPPFYEWIALTNGATGLLLANELYSATLAARASGDSIQTVNFYTIVPVKPGQSYIYSMEHNGVIAINTRDKNNVSINTGVAKFDEWLTDQTISVTVPSNVYYLVLLVGNNNSPSTAHTYKKPMLNIGSTAKPFKPREDSMLALQTDLYADPITGANADIIFERDGQYFKSKKWQRLTLDGSRAWIPGEGGATNGNRQVKVTGLAIGAVAGSGIGTKYDGKLLPQGSTGSSADTNAVTAAGEIYFGIPVADSGWADGYQPTQDDIKAYFYGYKAYDANTITPAQAQTMTTATWNGTGTKYWVQRVGIPNFMQSVPQQSYAGYTPYQLVYQLATPTVDPIVSEGQISFIEGDNQIEVGAGIVLREVVKLDDRDPASVYINSINSGTRFKYRSDKILSIYKNGAEDFSWYKGTYVYNGEFYAYGQIARLNFDQTSTYSATYLMLDKPLVVSFVGSYAANEKTLLLDLIDNIRQNTARVSVLESKKADKDSPAWITPTLLSGATPETDANKPQYTKMSDGMVLFRGAIKVPISGDVLLFNLPPEFRPSAPYTVISCWVSSSTHGQEAEGIVIRSDGSVRGNLKYVYDNWIRLDSIRFPTN